METVTLFVVDIPLTTRSILTIVLEATMQSVLQFRRYGVSSGNFWTCLLLSLLFLHNPFLAAPNSTGNLTVQHPPSYRATIASSELLKFKNPEGLESIVLRSIAFGDCEFSKAVILAQAQTRSKQPSDLEEILPPAQVPSSSLWYRPPPAA